MVKCRKTVSGTKVALVDDLSFLSDRHHRYGWIRRHYHHYRHKRAFRKAELVVVGDQKTAVDVVRYYFVPKEKIVVGSVILKNKTSLRSRFKSTRSKLFRRIPGLRR